MDSVITQPNRLSSRQLQRSPLSYTDVRTWLQAGEMAQWVRCLQLEDRDSNTQHPHRCKVYVAAVYNLGAWEAELG